MTAAADQDTTSFPRLRHLTCAVQISMGTIGSKSDFNLSLVHPSSTQKLRLATFLLLESAQRTPPTRLSISSLCQCGAIAYPSTARHLLFITQRSKSDRFLSPLVHKTHSRTSSLLYLVSSRPHRLQSIPATSTSTSTSDFSLISSLITPDPPPHCHHVLWRPVPRHPRHSLPAHCR